jgi:putative colanic acid biosynthesis acetyltransferase WcaF
VSKPASDLSLFTHQLHLSFVDKLKYAFWLLISNVFFLTNIPYPNFIKVFLLRMMGSQIGIGVVIKPWVKIKLPWKLTLGNHVWLGESCWIDNISEVYIGNHVCISQGALLLTGNHDYSKRSFDLMSKPIMIEDGVWVGAKSTIVGGVTLKSHCVTGVGVIVLRDTEAYQVYRINSNIQEKERVIK